MLTETSIIRNGGNATKERLVSASPLLFMTGEPSSSEIRCSKVVEGKNRSTRNGPILNALKA